jgi:hypothetical protein
MFFEPEKNLPLNVNDEEATAPRTETVTGRREAKSCRAVANLLCVQRCNGPGPHKPSLFSKLVTSCNEVKKESRVYCASI